MNKQFSNSMNQTISNINRIYVSLSSLSNDDFRLKSVSLQNKIRKSALKDLHNYLEEAYAIVKETARRFCIGDIRVTANEFDRALASRYPFVSIEGNDAIYHNKWIAGGVDFTWNMVHYDTQISCGVLLHDGYAVEMATGEGKTLAVTMPAFLNAIQHKGVHIQTANDYLSKRDCELTRPLYLFHGLTVDCIEYYNDNKKKKREAYAADITFGSNNTFVFDYLRDNMVHDLEQIVQRGHNYCIIDELDSILIDRACVPHVIEGEKISDGITPYLERVKPFIEELLSLDGIDDYIILDKLREQIMFTPRCVSWFNDKLNTSGLLSSSQNNLENMDEDTKNDLKEKNNLSWAIYIMLNAYLFMKKDVNYIIDRNQIIIIDQNTGRLDYNSRWNKGLHTAIEVKEGIPCQEDHRTNSFISLSNYFKLYNKCSGTSGTLKSVSEELLEKYNMPFAQIPTNKPCIRKDHPIRIFKSTQEKFNALLETVKEYHVQHRPILISCLTTKESDLISDKLMKIDLEPMKLNAKNLEKEAFVISHAGEMDSIMVSTAIAGRGTDIKLSEDASKNGGLLVISTSLFDSSRIDCQLKGRAGRQGDPGDSIFYISLEDVIIQYLSEEERSLLKQLSDNSDLDSKSAQELILLSQRYKEEGLRKQRDVIRKRDDLFSIFRKKFYRARLNVLKKPESSYEILNKTACTFNVESNYVSHLEDLYNQVCYILKNAKNSNIDGAANVIFSTKKYLYTIAFDIDRTLSDIDYFKRRYIQQITLNRYDVYWSLFIQEYENDLGMKESKLSKLFNSIKNEMEREILILLFGSQIPVNFAESSELKYHRTSQRKFSKKITKKENILNPSLPCPCGSGLTYSECHGKRWRFVNKECS